MNLGETVIYFGLEGVFLCGSISVLLCVSNIFYMRARFCMDASHIFPQCAGHYSLDG